MLDLFAKKKWESWNGLGNMSKEEAMKHYVEEINKVRKEYEAATKKWKFWVKLNKKKYVL